MADPIISTKYGQVRGARKKSDLGTDYFAFYGIRYAKAPVEELRFASPQEVEPWQGVFNATEEGPTAYCYEQTFHPVPTIIGDEDCLFVNVFTKNLKPSKPLPVLVYIHGGAFMNGSAHTRVYGPDYFMEKDVIVVVPQYRLGAFGFLSLKDPNLKVPGNAGLKDQNLALKWVQSQISAFGGDPNNVTLFGCSAGGASVHYHTISEASKNLFHRAVIISGTVFSNWSVNLGVDIPYRLAKALDYDDENEDTKVLEFLRAAEPAQIVKMQEKVLEILKDKLNGVSFPFGPVIEPYELPDCMVPKHPVLMAREAWGNKIDVIFSFCSNEALFIYKTITPEFFENLKTFCFLLPNDNEVEKFSPEGFALGDKIKEHFYGDAKPSMENIDIYLKIYSDIICAYGTHRALLSRLEYAKNAKTYLYRFNCDSPTQNYMKRQFARPDIPGCCHADDIAYLFKSQLCDVPAIYSQEFANVQMMIKSNELINHGVHRAILSRLEYAKEAKTYLYRFNCVSPTQNYMKRLFGTFDLPGACHADDVPYLFKSLLVDTTDVNSKDYKNVKMMIETYASFASNNDPNNDLIKPAVWESIKSSEDESVKCLNMDDQPCVGAFPEYDVFLFWDSLFSNGKLY